MIYRENIEEPQMVGESLIDYAEPDCIVTDEYLNNECFTLEEAMTKLKQVIHSHFHS